MCNARLYQWLAFNIELMNAIPLTNNHSCSMSFIGELFRIIITTIIIISTTIVIITIIITLPWLRVSVEVCDELMVDSSLYHSIISDCNMDHIDLKYR